MTEPFRLRCPKCLDSMPAHRDEHDPVDATVCEIICPSCDDGDRHSPRYFRCDGTEVLWRPDWAAQAIEARRAETAQQAPSQDESAVPKGCAR